MSKAPQKSVQRELILHQCIFLQVKRDDEHKMVKSKEVKDEEVARVPIAFAMIQLMKSLPKEVMEANLPGYISSFITHCLKEELVCFCTFSNFFSV